MRESLRFAVIGCGAVAHRYHLPALRRLRQAQLVAVVDRDLDWARATAHDFGGRAMQDLEGLSGLVDAALVATPNSTHADISSALLAMGIHVLCEKPLATNVADAKNLMSIANKAGARVMAAHSRRFGLQIRTLKNLVDAGALGPVIEMRLSLGGSYGEWASRTDFRRQPALSGGGVLMDTGIHLVDLALWLLSGTPTEVSCRLSRINGWEVEDNAEVWIEMEEHTRVHLACSFAWGLGGMLHVYGDEGWARAKLNDTTTLEWYNPRARICQRAGVQTFTFPPNDPYYSQLKHFCRALLEETPFLVAGDEVLEGLSVLATCYEQDLGNSLSGASGDS